MYLRSSKTHTEHMKELNAKTLLSQMLNGNQLHVTGNGRIGKNDNSSGGSLTATNSDTKSHTRLTEHSLSIAYIMYQV